ncbi:MAG: tRNA epoxyqueuosine(34) reductase QueG [Porphyromonas sp.]|nr:tRNA epoxyqueuosine(34) reductase QueG [Porphyromonas sp.]
MPLEAISREDLIKAEALRLGFYACGIARATEVDPVEYQGIEDWVASGQHGTMSYLERNHDLRRDPRLLQPGTQSIIMVAMNYYPSVLQPAEAPQFAYYAYGRDYHRVVKKRLDQLLQYIQTLYSEPISGRSFADSAPIVERYWAVQAGLGWRGKHGLLIIPGAGSFFVLGTLLVSAELRADKPQSSRCGRCTRCLDACPTQALLAPGLMDARRCISYLTIESSQEVPADLAPLLGNRLYGCDVCQQVCPWNRFSRPTTEPDYAPRAAILGASWSGIAEMNEADFAQAFAGSAVKRAGLAGLHRSLRAIKPELTK